jgi:hypothetical protein
MKPNAGPSHRTSTVVGGVALTLGAACATTGTGGGALEPRYVAVHNALAAMGLAQVGPIHEGSLLQGHEATVSVDLPAGCTTVVGIGGEGVGDIDAKLLDPHGRAIAHDTTNEPQAVLRACIDAPDTYTLVVRAAQGSGTWVAATWAGGIGPSAPASTAQTPIASNAPLGTCASPFPLAAGTTNGTTARGETTTTGSCATSKTEAPEAVYELDVSQRERVVIDVQARFDAVLYIRKNDCTDENAEVDCNDDVPGDGENHSRLELVLDPGKYYVFVDGYNRDAGNFRMTVTISDAVALWDGCRRAKPLASGAVVASSIAGVQDATGTSCGSGASGPEVPWSMTLAEPTRVRLVEHSDDFSPVLHVRLACAYEESELACADPSTSGTTDAVLARVFPAGSYTVFADSRELEAKGAYTLAFDTAPVEGQGTSGDTCTDAVTLPVHMSPGAGSSSVSVSGDTFPARDDVAGSCGGKGAADVFYRLDVDRRSRLSAQLSAEDAPHLLAAWRGCGAAATEVGCGRSLDTVLDPGTYFLAVDGFRPEAFGRFDLEVQTEDVSGQAAACASAAPLLSGRNAGTLAGAGDNFGTSCGSGAFGAGGPDRVYRLVVPARTTVDLSLNTNGFEGSIALRRTCTDGASAALAEVQCDSNRIQQPLEAGTYWVVVNSATPGHGGTYVLRNDRVTGDEDEQMKQGRVPFPMPIP